jgi:cell division protein FtsI (penicillin-binding protein 3)/stage V sporulation protein D (sporulation-specific penicillin-binding protein)
MESRARAIWILLFLACGFTVVSFNLIQIQLVQHAKYWRLAIMNHLHPERIEPQRGSIFDSEGNVLAQTVQLDDVRLDGKILDHPEENLPKIAAALQIPAGDLIDSFNPAKRDQLIATNADDGCVARLQALNLRALIYEPGNRRTYPNGELAAQILGFTDEDGRGLGGVEKEVDKALSGLPGERWVERDGKRNEIAAYETRETPAVDGFNVTLTIKTAVQHVIETELDQIVQNYQPDAAHIIVMNPQTGEILAMASRPTFDPNNRATFKPDAVRERCLTDMVEPGSIFKMITLAGALNEGLVNLETEVFCENGSFFYGGKILRDDEPHGMLPVVEVMSQSSNIGFAKIALDYLHPEKLYRYATAFGIGHKTGLFSDQGESPGLLRPLSKWSALSVTRIPMGQEVGATPLQMTTAMCAIANGGRLMAPQLIKEIDDQGGHALRVYPPRMVRQVITPETAGEVAKALEQVTIDGTAKGIKIPGYSFAGKTGTAQKFVNGAYSHTQFVSSFIGFMPAQDPAFVALVMVDNPKTAKYYGAEVSAPAFANIAGQIAQILNIAPDRPSQPAPLETAATTPSTL